MADCEKGATCPRWSLPGALLTHGRLGPGLRVCAVTRRVVRLLTALVLALPVQLASAGTQPPAEQETAARAAALSQQVVVLYGQGRLREAVMLARESLRLFEEALGPHHPNVLTALSNLAEALAAQGDHRAARAVLQRMVDIEVAVHGRSHPDLAKALGRLAEALITLGDYPKAKACWEEAVAITERVAGPDHADTLRVLNSLANLLTEMGEYEAALQAYQRILATRTRTLGPDHLDVAVSQNNLGALLANMGDLPAALGLHRKALQTREKALGPSHPDVATSLNNVAHVLQRQGEYAQARPLFQRALQIWEKAHGPQHPDVALAASNLALLLQLTGDYAAARPLCERALQIWEKTYGRDHPVVATGLNNLARLLQLQGAYQAARALYERSLKIRTTALGPGHPSVATSLDNLAGLLQRTGDLSQARTLSERALALRERGFGPDSLDVARSLNNLGEILRDAGDLSAARLAYQRALRIWRAATKSNDPERGVVMLNFATLLRTSGDLQAARDLYSQAHAVLGGALGPAHPDVARAELNLAGLLRELGDTDAAAPLYERALHSMEGALGPEHPDVATVLDNLAHLLLDIGSDARALPLAQRALQIRKKAWGPLHPDVALSLNNVAYMLQKRGDLEAAKPLYAEALAISDKALGPLHTSLADLLENLAALELSLGQADDAWGHFGRAQAIARKHRDAFYAGGVSDADKLLFSRQNRTQRDLYLSAAVERARLRPEAADVVLSLALDRKGLLLEAAMPVSGHPEPPAIAGLRARLRDAAARLSRAWLGSAASPELTDRNLQELERNKDALQAELSRKSAQFRTELTAARMDRRGLCAALGPGRLAVEFVRYDHAIFGQQIRWEPRLLALVTDPAACSLTVLELGEWPTLAASLATLRKNVQAGQSRGAQALGDHVPDDEGRTAVAKGLFGRLIAPWLDRLGKSQQVVLIPDDDLAFAPFAALVAPDGKYLVQMLDFSLLDSSRELARLQGSGAAGTGALLVGGPDFDAETGRRGGSAKTAPGAVASRLAQVRPAVSTSRWAALPGAAAEARQLATLLSATPGPRGLNPKLLLGAAATEAAWKDAAPGQRYLHLATHGYFSRTAQGPQRAAAERNPLLLSGLLLAGANTPANASDGVEDGWLSAEEVAGLDLQGTELVVLSACETGLGGAGSGEGVFGLRRAFFQAGARGLVMSLWNVDDEATAHFMQKFWTRLLACSAEQNCTKAKALADTQRDMLSDARWSTPQYWAAFVYAGDWRR